MRLTAMPTELPHRRHVLKPVAPTGSQRSTTFIPATIEEDQLDVVGSARLFHANRHRGHDHPDHHPDRNRAGNRDPIEAASTYRDNTPYAST